MIKKILHYIRHEGAVAAIIFAMMLPAVMASVGVGVDLAIAYNAKNRLGNALDKAVLAAASSTGTTEELEERMRAFFDANYPSGKYGTPFDITLTISGSVMTASASVAVPTTFMSIFGEDSIEIASEAQVVRELAGIEAVLVLDVTGSMAGNNIAALKTASTSFLNTMFSKVSDVEFLRIGIVPWSDAVNVGPYGKGLNAQGVADGSTAFVDNPATDTYVTPASSIVWGSGVNDWGGCVLERDAASALTDDTAPPNWKMYRYPPGSCTAYNCTGYSCAQYNCQLYNCSKCSSGKVFKGTCSTKGATCTTYSSTCKTYGTTCVQQGSCNSYGNTCVDWRNDPNTNCPDAPIVPLTNDQAVLQNSIDTLPTEGNTYSNLGMIWGWRVISPEFPFTEGAAYADPKWSKTVILMTDGNNTINSTYSGEGAGGSAGVSTTATQQNSKFATICTNMKNKGIRIYTVTFQSNISSATKAYYRDCATSQNMYYDAPTNQSLADAFAKIADQLSQLHLTK